MNLSFCPMRQMIKFIDMDVILCKSQTLIKSENVSIGPLFVNLTDRQNLSLLPEMLRDTEACV